ncbi:hypothetical protein NOI24_16305 [Neorhizobium galegae]|uniref:hypothetical protein n=1 Tax=Neorhizobium galegae TaxID=399 RepID=UPI0021027404|nr:hypothetical protein [Neorhizobium galegae]MCQ1772873.1 hypothetical protein [Neorhizobium galegae]MCQ1799180.1 hypothetical protein [Neorhizobium galegae]
MVEFEQAPGNYTERRCIPDGRTLLNVLAAKVVAGRGTVSVQPDADCFIVGATNQTQPNQVCYQVPEYKLFRLEMRKICSTVPADPFAVSVTYAYAPKPLYERNFLRGSFCSNSGSRMSVLRAAASTAITPSKLQPDRLDITYERGGEISNVTQNFYFSGSSTFVLEYFDTRTSSVTLSEYRIVDPNAFEAIQSLGSDLIVWKRCD